MDKMLKDQGERRVSKTAPSGEQKADPGISRRGTTTEPPNRIDHLVAKGASARSGVTITPEMVAAGIRSLCDDVAAWLGPYAVQGMVTDVYLAMKKAEPRSGE